ncbi:MAG: FAD-dependent oxidoreductase [Deltaproteobacteria bacterium HGW-Deltaproteobacteria-21]|nr:MAG: FAD-dependent oxidoreductase [Deltaproteobacteria bacterium HGW-Deltaproteobacteria-21]
MPPLEKPNHVTTVRLPSRSAQVAGESDILVVGGGPAGIGAAMGAADASMNVILAEHYGFLGGNATAALTIPLSSFHSMEYREKSPGAPTLFPSDHGEGRPVIGGVLRRLVEKLVQEGGAIPPGPGTGYTVPFDPEVFKMVCLDLLDEAGVRFLFHSFASGVFLDQRMQGVRMHGVIFETKSGPLIIRAKVIIDCTGDGDVAAMAGAEYEIGREEDGLVQPMSLLFRIGEFEKKAFENYARAHPDQWSGVHGLWDLIRKAHDEGHLDLPREDILLFGMPHENEVLVNSTRIAKVLGTDVWDLTYAEWQGRRQMRMITAFLRKYVPGFEKSYVIQSGVNTGVRETRRIMGEYKLTGDDILQARKFDDVVARGAYPVDIHSPTGKGTVLKRVPPGEAYDIPLRCLLPLGLDRILVAGRCISGTHEANASYRVMPISIATGHAAGVCAGIAVRMGRKPKEVPFEEVRKELIRQGADLRNVQSPM